MSDASEVLAKAELAAANWRMEHAAKSAELDRVKSMKDLDPNEDPAEVSVRVAERVLQLSTALDVAASAIVSADSQVDDARRALLLERAAGMRARAAAVRSRAAELRATVDGLVAKIAEIDGVDYIAPPFPAAVGTGSNWRMPKLAMMANLAGSFEKLAGEDEQRAKISTSTQLAVDVRRQLPEVHHLEPHAVRVLKAA